MKIVLFANTDWYLYNFRRSFALALQKAGHEVVLISPDGPYGERLQASGLRWESVPMDRSSLSPVRELLLMLYLLRFFRRERPDLVHGFTIKCAVYGSVAARLTRVRARVNAVAGMGYVFISDETKARLLRPIVRTLLKLALSGSNTRLVLQNPDDCELFRAANLVQNDSIRLIAGSGVDCLRFSPGAVRNGTSRLRVLLPARVLWDKGVGEFVEASRWLRAQGREIDFLLAGVPDPGNPASVAVDVIESWVAAGDLVWLGQVEDMPALYRSVDVVALPSYREGLPKGLIEAGACGVALITTDVPGCREVVRDGVDGLLVPVKNAAALAQAIARLQDDASLRCELGDAARRRVLESFDERIVIARTMAVYEEILHQ